MSAQLRVSFSRRVILDNKTLECALRLASDVSRGLPRALNSFDIERDVRRAPFSSVNQAINTFPRFFYISYRRPRDDKILNHDSVNTVDIESFCSYRASH